MDSNRRRIITGVGALPLVLTVRSGSAGGLARTSAFACIERDAQRAQLIKPEPMQLADGDDWLRAELDIYRLEIFENGGMQPIDGKYFIGMDGTTYWRVQDQLGSLSAVPSPYTTGSCIGTKTGSRMYGLVHISSTGAVRGVAFEDNGGYPVTGTCHASFLPIRI